MKEGNPQQVHEIVASKNDEAMDVSSLSREQPRDNVSTKSQFNENTAGCQEKFMTENGRAVHKSILKPVLRNRETQQKKGDVRQENEKKDLVCFPDPDVIATSSYPFPNGGNFPFEANKDEKMIDVEDGIESDDIFDSVFSKKLMEILKRSYDKKGVLGTQ
ncbi:unnamed protein product [Arabis nemorensis]|uniref:Uncharacterized protein n=1 Tax=Arabis nemorensis TaxID=586526 RepID=A0A565ATF9_9BRAS|nr:unnamed protein product [Arabis nemorensis]